MNRNEEWNGLNIPVWDVVTVTAAATAGATVMTTALLAVQYSNLTQTTWTRKVMVILLFKSIPCCLRHVFSTKFFFISFIVMMMTAIIIRGSQINPSQPLVFRFHFNSMHTCDPPHFYPRFFSTVSSSGTLFYHRHGLYIAQLDDWVSDRVNVLLLSKLIK